MDETASKLAAVTARKTVTEKITAEKKAANISISSPALSATSATTRATQNKSQSSLKVGMSSQRLESFSTPEDSKPHEDDHLLLLGQGQTTTLKRGAKT